MHDHMDQAGDAPDGRRAGERAGTGAARASALPRIGIVGAGMAGVSLAWMLDGHYEVTLIEAGPTIGGNVRGVDVDLDGHQFVVRHRRAVLPSRAVSGLHRAALVARPVSAGSRRRALARRSRRRSPSPRRATPLPRFVSPVIPSARGRSSRPWNSAGTSAFGTLFAAARLREQSTPDWALTLGDWLPTLGLTQAQWEGMLLPWAASLFSGSIDQARGLSARAAMIFAAKALPRQSARTALVLRADSGMGDELRRLVDQCPTLQVRTNAAVQQRDDRHDRRVPAPVRGWCNRRRWTTSSSRPPVPPRCSSCRCCRARRTRSPPSRGSSSTTRGSSCTPIRSTRRHIRSFWSFLNCGIDGAHCEASMWLAPVLAGVPPATAAKLWKSWTTHRQQQPAQVLHEPRSSTCCRHRRRSRRRTASGWCRAATGIWFAGGYTFPYDAQETALLSALSVALGIGASTARVRALERAR